jgi:hypothetical protein
MKRVMKCVGRAKRTEGARSAFPGRSAGPIPTTCRRRRRRRRRRTRPRAAGPPCRTRSEVPQPAPPSSGRARTFGGGVRQTETRRYRRLPPGRSTRMCLRRTCARGPTRPTRREKCCSLACKRGGAIGSSCCLRDRLPGKADATTRRPAPFRCRRGRQFRRRPHLWANLYVCTLTSLDFKALRLLFFEGLPS